MSFILTPSHVDALTVLMKPKTASKGSIERVIMAFMEDMMPSVLTFEQRCEETLRSKSLTEQQIEAQLSIFKPAVLRQYVAKLNDQVRKDIINWVYLKYNISVIQ